LLLIDAVAIVALVSYLLFHGICVAMFGIKAKV